MEEGDWRGGGSGQSCVKTGLDLEYINSFSSSSFFFFFVLSFWVVGWVVCYY